MDFIKELAPLTPKILVALLSIFAGIILFLAGLVTWFLKRMVDDFDLLRKGMPAFAKSLDGFTGAMDSFKSETISKYDIVNKRTATHDEHIEAIEDHIHQIDTTVVAIASLGEAKGWRMPKIPVFRVKPQRH